MRKSITYLLSVILIFGCSFTCMASSPLFKLTTFGSTLKINTTIPGQTYANAGIKIITSGFSIANQAATCTLVASNGYCLFTTSDTNTKSIVVNGPNAPFTVTLCLNGPGALKCQNFTNQNYVVYQPVPEVPNRLQWHQNFGYCGETSFITAGFALGQYVSQYTMRSLASPNVNQYDASSQLLLGVNDNTTADKVRYNYDLQSNCTNQSKNFLKWVKTSLYQGHPVIIGVYTNEYLFYKNEVSPPPTPCIYNPNAESCTAPFSCVPTGIPNSKSLNGLCQYGDPEYDHIVTVKQITTQHPCTGVGQCDYYDDDTITIEDHGLYSSECDYGNPSMGCPPSQLNLCKMSTTSNYQYLYTYTFQDFQKSREDANSPTGNVYALSNTPVGGDSCTGNYGIAILGIKGVGLLPVNVSVNENYECDMVQDNSNEYYPVSGSGAVVHNPITLTVTVSNMVAGKSYNLYQYNSFDAVPQSNFNQHAGNASNSWVIQSSTGSATRVVGILNNETAIFRAVAIDAP